MWLQVINKVKVTHQGEGHINIKVKYLHPFKFYVARILCKRVVCIRLKCYLLIIVLQIAVNQLLVVHKETSLAAVSILTHIHLSVTSKFLLTDKLIFSWTVVWTLKL